MRQIKFRGKCQRGYDYSDGDGWVYGSLLQKDKVCAIVKTEDIDLSPKTDDGYSFVEDFGCIPVLPDTVSQFTGLTDRNGKDIYEGDILETKYEDKCEEGGFGIARNGVSFKIGCFGTIGEITREFLPFSDYPIKDEYIIGNIHDNPELLNEKQ